MKFWTMLLSQVHSICHRSRGLWKIEGRSLHSGRTKVPGNTPRSFGNWPLRASFDRDFIEGPVTFLAEKLLLLYAHLCEAWEKDRYWGENGAKVCANEELERALLAKLPAGRRSADAMANCDWEVRCVCRESPRRRNKIRRSRATLRDFKVREAAYRERRSPLALLFALHSPCSGHLRLGQC